MPTPADLWAIIDPITGMGERPDGSNNAPPITDWYYDFQAAWCVMTESYGLAHAGFSDDGGETLNLTRLIGITQTTPKGWAYVPYLEDAFRDVGRFFDQPEEGDFFIVEGQSHTGMVWRVNSDGTVNTVEGNYGNHLALGRRRINDLRGFCRPPWDGQSGTVVTETPSGDDYLPFPGNTRMGSRGEAVKQVQRRLVVHGHDVSVDGAFGPLTDRRVRIHQKAWKLEVDGVVGPITWTTLRVTPD